MSDKKCCKILMIVGDFVEDYEVMVPFQTLQVCNAEVHAVCPGRKKGDKVKTAIHDFEGDDTYTEKPGHNFNLNYDFDSVNVEEYDGLVIPGGRAPEYLRLNDKVIKMVDHFFENKKPIATICHGIQVFTATQHLKGRKVTCYPACSVDVKLCGAEYQDIGDEEAYVDDNLVTAKAWPAHVQWLRKFLDLFKKCEQFIYVYQLQKKSIFIQTVQM